MNWKIVILTNVINLILRELLVVTDSDNPRKLSLSMESKETISCQEVIGYPPFSVTGLTGAVGQIIFTPGLAFA